MSENWLERKCEYYINLSVEAVNLALGKGTE